MSHELQFIKFLKIVPLHAQSAETQVYIDNLINLVTVSLRSRQSFVEMFDLSNINGMILLLHIDYITTLQFFYSLICVLYLVNNYNICMFFYYTIDHDHDHRS